MSTWIPSSLLTYLPQAYIQDHTHTHTSTDRYVHDQCKVASVLGEWWSVDMKGKRDQELAFMIDQRVTWQPGEDFLLDRSAAQMDSATYHGLCVCVCLCVYNCIKRKTSFPKTGSVQYPMECLFLMPCSAVSVCLHLFSPRVSKSTMCLKHPRRFWNEGFHSVPSEALLINSAAVMGGGIKISHFNSAEDMSTVFFFVGDLEKHHSYRRPSPRLYPHTQTSMA